MKRLLNALTEWQYRHSSRRTRDRIDWLESQMAAMEAVLDRFPLTPAPPAPRPPLASVTTIHMTVEQ